MTLPLHRIITRISVRARIIVLAAIPVVGFMANGIAYTAGEREVEHAFRTADRAADLAEVSREFRGTLIQMRVRTRDFALRSSQELIQAFETTHDSAVRTFGIIEAAIDAADAAKIRALESPARGNRRAVRRSRAQPENSRLHGIGGHPRPHDQGGAPPWSASSMKTCRG